MGALNDRECIKIAERSIGNKISEVEYIQYKECKFVYSKSGKPVQKLRFGLQKFEKCQIVAVPSTATKGKTDEYIELFKEKIYPILVECRDSL